ncbi:MAG: hypothetical protein IJQ62_02195 [Clostridia bacterium]|nr:hypothetical protein [Clostridia bacterium]
MSKVFDEIREEKAIRIAKNLIKMGKSTLQEIAEVTELSMEKVQELAEAKPDDLPKEKDAAG